MNERYTLFAGKPILLKLLRDEMEKLQKEAQFGQGVDTGDIHMHRGHGISGDKNMGSDEEK